jgi:hypothetical protein
VSGVRILRVMRPLLEHYARRLYANAGGTQSYGPREVHKLVSFVEGEKIGKRAAWEWLHARYEPCIKGLPSVPRRARPKGDGFYASDEWRALRFKALKGSDGRCSLCDRSKRHDGVTLHVDHIKPRSKFPALELVLSNLHVLCEDCNLGKSNRDDTDWRATCQ